MLNLACVVLNEGETFTVKIDANELVAALKAKLKKILKKIVHYRGPSDRIELYCVDGLKDLSTHFELNHTPIDDFASKLLIDFESSIVKMADSSQLSSYSLQHDSSDGRIHILVVLPAPPLGPFVDVPDYVVSPIVREDVKKATFVVLDESTRRKHVAVTCDSNLAKDQKVGQNLSILLNGVKIQVVLRARHFDLSLAFLESPTRQPYLFPWRGDPKELVPRWDLVLATFQVGADDYQGPYKGELAFTPTPSIVLGRDNVHIMHSCPVFPGNSGAPLILKDGRLVGIHLEVINALPRALKHKNIKEKGCIEEMSSCGLAQVCSAIILDRYTSVVSKL
ncbi:unnamed protein product [Aphanomyces euteiches]